MIVACVLKTSENGEYRDQHVYRLEEVVRSFSAKRTRRKGAIKFVCLTDNPALIGSETICVWALQHDWPRWWAKINLFNPHAFFEQPVLYFDLDTDIVGDIAPLLDWVEGLTRNDKLFALRDFYHPENLQSSVMAWHSQSHAALSIFSKFLRDPVFFQQKYDAGGDQLFIQETVKTNWTPLQDVFPGWFASYKIDLAGKPQPLGVRVAVYHGKPRPWEAPLPWSAFAWQ